jgi:hypothetical protein
MLATVVAGVVAPLLRAPTFYYWDDTAGASVGAWRNIADHLLEGRFPLLDLELWRGGNYAAEAAFGLYNPLLLGLYVGTRPIDDLAVAVAVVKGFFFLTMALGAYLLAREHGAKPWPSAVLGAALPLCGFTLWMDGAAWVTGLTVTALTPWVWLTARRAATGRGGLLWVVVAGYLCASAGNPYGLLSAGIVFLGVLVEGLVQRRGRRLWAVVGAGMAVLLLSMLTYLPFVLSSSVSYRAGSETLNDEFLSPNLSDLAGLSSPSFQPYMNAFGLPYFTFPALYLAWFVLPLVPWFRWRALRERAAGLTGVVVVGVVYLLLVLGPSQIWFFRWPVRLVPYLWLAVAVLLAVLLSAGLERDRARLRWAFTGAAVVWGFWAAWSDVPEQWDRHAVSAVLVLGATVLMVRALRRSEAWGAAVALLGTVAMLVVQLSWMPVNGNVLDYQFPRSQAQLEDTFAKYRPGLTVQVAAIEQTPRDRGASGVYGDLLFGSMYAVAGVESLTAYSGVGFNALDRAQCMAYQGSTCPEAWDALWERPPGADAVLADLLRAERVVVQRSLVDTRRDPVPEGWSRVESDRFVDVYQRDDPLPYPDGRLSDLSGPAEVTDDVADDGVREVLDVRRTAPGDVQLTFARLAWPGYTVTLDGTPLRAEQGAAGLLTVTLPADADGGRLVVDWDPPGNTAAQAAAGLGLALTAGLVAVDLVGRRRTRRAAVEQTAETRNRTEEGTP